LNISKSNVMATYSRQNIFFKKGEGCWIWDINGNKYLDAIAGIAVNTLGHSHKELLAALSTQLSKVIHTSNLYVIPNQERLANKLCSISGLHSAFFCNSGLEANETAIKIARKYGIQKGYSIPKIIVFDKAFHGRSFATLSASANQRIKNGFGPLLEGFLRVQLNDIESLKTVVRQNKDAVAVFLETIQGEGGINITDSTFLQQLSKICKQHDLLLIIDEVQCGIGRTGKWFAYQWSDISPDIIPVAKGLGSGIPIGAVLANEKCSKILSPGDHGSTFGGNPLAMQAGITTLEQIEREGLLSNAMHRGKQILDSLKKNLDGLNGIKDIRGKGLMIGIEFNDDCKVLVEKAAKAGFLINVTENRIVRILPPLIISPDECDYLVKNLISIFKEHLSQRL